MLTAAHANLQRLALTRLGVVAVMAAALLYAYGWSRTPLPYASLLAVLGLLVALSAATLWRLGWRWPASDVEFFGQLLLDIAAVSAMLYWTGGATNPFVSYYLVPLSMAAALLPARMTAALALISVCLYTALLFFHEPLPVLIPHAPDGLHDSHNGITAHVFGMWFNFALSAALITYVVVRMAGTLREQRDELNRRREWALHNEQLLGVATLAAGTAHELGTPLNAITVLLDDLQHDCPDNEEDIALLQQQVAHCRRILKKLAHTAEAQQSGTHPTLPAVELVQQVLGRWQLLRPGATYSLRITADAATAPLLEADDALQQAIVNLLNNGADTNSGPLELTLDWADGWVELRIRDHGPGIDLALADRLGKTFVTSKQGKGLGLGLFLSHATAERHGGEIRLYNHTLGGTEAVLRLPVITEAAA